MIFPPPIRDAAENSHFLLCGNQLYSLGSSNSSLYIVFRHYGAACFHVQCCSSGLSSPDIELPTETRSAETFLAAPFAFRQVFTSILLSDLKTEFPITAA